MCKLKEKYKSLKKKGKHGAMYVSTVVKIISCVVIGALVISGLAVVTNGAMNSASGKVDSLFAKSYNYEGGGGAVIPGAGETLTEPGLYSRQNRLIKSWNDIVAESNGNVTSTTVKTSTFGSSSSKFACNNAKLVLPDTITTIEDGSFSGGTFDQIVIPNNITTLGTFENCTIESLNIGAGVTSISTPLFDGTTVKSITVDPENTKFDARTGNAVYSKTTDTFLAGTKYSTIAADTKDFGPLSLFNQEFDELHIPELTLKYEWTGSKVSQLSGAFNTENIEAEDITRFNGGSTLPVFYKTTFNKLTADPQYFVSYLKNGMHSTVKIREIILAHPEVMPYRGYPTGYNRVNIGKVTLEYGRVYSSFNPTGCVLGSAIANAFTSEDSILNGKDEITIKGVTIAQWKAHANSSYSTNPFNFTKNVKLHLDDGDIQITANQNLRYDS